MEQIPIKIRIISTKSKFKLLSRTKFSRLFVLVFENDTNVEIKNYNVTIDGKNFFDQSIKNDKITCKNIRKIANGKGDGYTTGCLLDYAYFKNYCKIIAIDLSKQQALDTDPRAIQQINFTLNSDRAGNTRVYFILEEAKETFLEFSQGTVKVL